MKKAWVVAVLVLGFSFQVGIAASTAVAAAASGLVDFNLATKEQLMTLPGIGEEEAGKIIAGRPYGEKTDLMRKKILPSAVLYRILDKTTIDFDAMKDDGNAKEKKAFRAEMARSKNIRTVKTGTGLAYQDLKVGHGAKVVKGKKVRVHYTGWLEDGTKFDSSVDRKKPITFTPGKGEVIGGWEEGILSMREGGKRRLIIPPSLGYGEKGSGSRIPPNATLIFDVELMAVQR